MTVLVPGPRSRRSVLAAALGALVAVVGALIGRASPVDADGETIKVGGEYRNAHSTTFIKTASGVKDIGVLAAESRGLGTAVSGNSPGGWGVTGFSGIGPGVAGVSLGGVGVLGIAGTDAAPLSGGRIAVYARGIDDVLGLRASGRVWFERRSGIAVLAAGRKSVSINLPDGVSPSTFVLVTPLGDPGNRRIWSSTLPSEGRVVIHASSATQAGLRLAWLALEKDWAPTEAVDAESPTVAYR